MVEGVAGAPDVEDPRVTVVVISRNRRAELLASLGRHRAPVVYVDNASEDGSVEAVREQHPSVQVVPLGYNAGAVARTEGVRRAGTPFVAFADDDSWWAPGSLAAAAQALADHPRLALVNAHILVGPQERPDTVCAEMAHSPLPRPAGIPGAPLLGFVACAAMVRTRAFLAAGGFDDVVRFPGEEERLALDLAAAGWAMSYLEQAVVHHHPSPRREDRAARARGITRSRLLTALLRLPWPVVGARVREGLTGGAASRTGTVEALRRARPALRARTVVPADLVTQLQLLEAFDPAAVPAADQHGGSS